MNKAYVCVIDDDPAIRRSLEMMLEAHGLASLAYASAFEFLDNFDVARPGCIVLDLRIPGMTGEELLKTLREGGVQIPVIVITGHGDVSNVVRTMKLGLVDFLEKPVDHALLMETIRHAIARDETLRKDGASIRAIEEKIGRLTPRERELMGMLARGKTSKEIAGVLSVSIKTVDNHRAHLLSKLEASNVAELAAIAVRAGLG